MAAKKRRRRKNRARFAGFGDRGNAALSFRGAASGLVNSENEFRAWKNFLRRSRLFAANSFSLLVES
jgi:hypothetical protein